MKTKIFIGYPLDYALKEALSHQEHSLIITLKEGKEYIGLRLHEECPSLRTLHYIKEQVCHQLHTLCTMQLFDSSHLVLFPEILIG